MLRRRKKNGGVSDMMEGQDSFLDIVSNIVGILIILVMIAGVRAQHTDVNPIVPITDELAGTSSTMSNKSNDKLNDETNAKSTETTKYADEKQIHTLEEKLDEYKRKEQNAQNIRQTMTDIQITSEQIVEQIQLQENERNKLLDLIVDLRTEIEIHAEEKGEETKNQIELQRQINEINAKLEQIERTKQWIESERPQAIKLENKPTPISKTVEESEAHFRIKNGKIVYVPIVELNESFKQEFTSSRKKFNNLFANKTTTGRVGPISDFVMDYLVVRYGASSGGGEIGQRLVLDSAVYTTKKENAGTHYKDAITQPNSDFLRLVQLLRQDIYTITFWVYPDSFEAYSEVKQFLHSKGYKVAARPLNPNDEIRASSRGTKSSAQ
ncbi:MAG: hypothetical protein LBB88_07555 [Planctomycetaceae bacterium]|jgi:hypothetical protein|nr:hypothetical protein [Planctomycetaceae bacterium]